MYGWDYSCPHRGVGRNLNIARAPSNDNPLGMTEGQGNEGLAACLFPGGNNPAILGIPAVSVILGQVLRDGGGFFVSSD